MVLESPYSLRSVIAMFLSTNRDTLYRLNHELQLQDDYAWVTDPALLSDCAATGDNPVSDAYTNLTVQQQLLQL